MLSADHYALEHRAVQQLIDLRHREVQFLTDRFNAVGTQSSLIGGFVVTVLTAVDVTGPDTSPVARNAFWLSSALSLACSFHCLLNSTFAAVWGPGLALRGPDGSVSRAFYNLRSDQKHVMVAFAGSVFFFVIQVVAVFFALDHTPTWTPPAVGCSIIMVLGSLVSTCTITRMRGRFAYKSDDSDMDTIEKAVIGDHHDGARPSGSLFGGKKKKKNTGSSRAEMRSPLLGADDAAGRGGGAGGAGVFPEEKEAVQRSSSVFDIHSTFSSPFACRGYLQKRGRRSSALGEWAAQWVTRFYVLDGVKLTQFSTEDDFAKGEEAADSEIMLNGYEVLVRTAKPGEEPVWQFTLSSLTKSAYFKRGNGKRDRTFRVDTEDELRMWVSALVAASIVS